MSQVVTQTAPMRCNQGNAPMNLVVTMQQIVKINGNLVATVDDVVPLSNIPPFGTCKILTTTAQGVPTPCVPAPTGPWQPGSKIQKINGFAVLTKDSKCTCGIGGQISFDSPGQAMANES